MRSSDAKGYSILGGRLRGCGGLAVIDLSPILHICKVGRSVSLALGGSERAGDKKSYLTFAWDRGCWPPSHYDAPFVLRISGLALWWCRPRKED